MAAIQSIITATIGAIAIASLGLTFRTMVQQWRALRQELADCADGVVTFRIIRN